MCWTAQTVIITDQTWHRSVHVMNTLALLAQITAGAAAGAALSLPWTIRQAYAFAQSPAIPLFGSETHLFICAAIFGDVHGSLPM